jgi:hypothetical protein
MGVRTYRRSSSGKSLSRPGASFSILLKCRYLNCKTQREAGFSSETHFAERAHITDRHTIKTKRAKERIGRLVLAHWKSSYTLIQIEQNANGCGTKRCSCVEKLFSSTADQRWSVTGKQRVCCRQGCIHLWGCFLVCVGFSSALIQVCIKTSAWSRLNNFAHFRQIYWAGARVHALCAIGSKRLLFSVVYIKWDCARTNGAQRKLHSLLTPA